MATIVSLLWPSLHHIVKTLTDFYNKLFSECPPTHSNMEENATGSSVSASTSDSSASGSSVSNSSASASASGDSSLGLASDDDIQHKRPICTSCTSNAAGSSASSSSASDSSASGSSASGGSASGGSASASASGSGLGSASDNDILSEGPGRALILFVDTSKSEVAHLLFLELESGFRIIINRFREEFPPHLREKSQRDKEIYALQVAIRENKDFLKNRKFRLFLTSIPLFLYLLNANPDQLDFLKPFSFTLAFGRKE